MAGISRSATIAAAYLMMKFGYEMSTVINLLQRKRKQVQMSIFRSTQIQDSYGNFKQSKWRRGRYKSQFRANCQVASQQHFGPQKRSVLQLGKGRIRMSLLVPSIYPVMIQTELQWGWKKKIKSKRRALPKSRRFNWKLIGWKRHYLTR